MPQDLGEDQNSRRSAVLPEDGATGETSGLNLSLFPADHL